MPLNKAQLIGHLGADPEIKSFQNGGRIANLRLATSERWKDRHTGERKERTEWHSVVLQSDGLVGVAERYLRKGSKLYVEGQLRTRKWQDRDGKDRFTTEIVVGGFDGKIDLLDPRRDGASEGGAPGSRHDGEAGISGAGGDSAAGGRQDSGRHDSYPDLDDDIPF